MFFALETWSESFMTLGSILSEGRVRTPRSVSASPCRGRKARSNDYACIDSRKHDGPERERAHRRRGYQGSGSQRPRQRRDRVDVPPASCAWQPVQVLDRHPARQRDEGAARNER